MEARPLNQSTLPLTITVSSIGSDFSSQLPFTLKKVSASSPVSS